MNFKECPIAKLRESECEAIFRKTMDLEKFANEKETIPSQVVDCGFEVVDGFEQSAPEMPEIN
jgi:hypothetical protein